VVEFLSKISDIIYIDLVVIKGCFESDVDAQVGADLKDIYSKKLTTTKSGYPIE